MTRKLFFWLFSLLFPFLYGYAQVQPLPLDPEIVYGKLDNGLTYYIRQNAQPERRAEFYLVQRTGSLQEEENQRGLAHVLEHLAFSGSKHFPQGIDDYLERIGLKSGDNVNAYTAFNETVFMIMNAPIEKAGVVDSCLLFLRDVSSALSLDPSAIERERAIIREEWRSDRNAASRLRELLFPVLLEGSKYAERLPIGRIEVIESFTPQDLRAYYEKWYRPDLQAVIVVGDLNPEEVKERLTALFDEIPVPPTAIDLPKELVPRRDEPVVTIAKDTEASDFVVNLFFKHDKMPDSLYVSVEGVRKDFLQMVSATMLNERFDELLYGANPPFVYAQSSDGNYLGVITQAAWSVAAVAEEGKIDSTLYALSRETERVKRFGFTHSEYERVKVNVLKYYETQYLERESEESFTYANVCMDHFVYGGYLPAIATEFDLINRLAEEVSLEEVNEHARAIFAQRDVVISVTGPEKEASGTYPDEAALLAIFNDIHTCELDSYQEEDYLLSLLGEIPDAGEIIKEEKDTLFNATVLTLSNGVKVVAKPTAFKEDEIVIAGASPGGSTLFDEKDRTNLKALEDVVSLGGLGGYSLTSLNRALAGKSVTCSFSIGENSESIGGYSSASDLRTFFELVYLYFTDTQMDEAAFSSYLARLGAQLKNADLDPMVAFGDSLTSALFGNKPEMMRINEAELKQLDYSRIMEMYRERFGDASDFVFTLVGRFDMDSVRLYAKEYLAVLPVLNRVEKGNEGALPPYRTGTYTNHFRKKMETPKSSVVHFYHGKSAYSLKNSLSAKILTRLLDLVYMEKVRKEEGGVYSVDASAKVYSFPDGRTTLQLFYDTDPQKLERINAVVLAELHRLANSPAREEDLAKIKENLKKTNEESRTANVYWLSVIDNYYFNGFNAHTSYLQTLDSITAEDVRAFADKLLSAGNHIELIMSPEE